VKVFIFGFASVIFCLLFACAKKSPVDDSAKRSSRIMGESPPAYVQKAWNAKYDYDKERRLLVPKYAGSRWGSIQEYREDGRLSYQDWWVRDVKVEDLEEDPDTEVNNLIDEEGIIEAQTKAKEAKEAKAAKADVPEEIEDEIPQVEEAEEEFIPSPFLPF